ncbi:flippase [Limosilactobacillus fermentum]|uniref:oligosaccharide flippase family protein n=1 Tax=Limosilactobacillus fermentum TaxID=1613 RepID=UPI000B4C8BA7|nr:oligosaccharide flippase family protein [Limosilactobacillus fermentum]OWP36078.1 flippase [Limosilactobacillus fermentum]
MNKKVLKNYLYNLTYQMLNVIIPFITAPYVSRVLGPSGVGDYNYIYGIVSYFGVFAVTGTVAYGQREIAKRQKDIVSRSKLFWDIFYFRLFSTVLVTIVYSYFTMNFLVKYRSLLLVNYVLIFSWILDVSWYFQGVENFKVTAVRNSFVRIISTVMIFVFVKSRTEVWLFTLIMCGSSLLGNVTMIPYLKNEIKILNVNLKEIFSRTRGIMSLFFPVIAIQLYTVLNKVMLGAMGSSREVGFYSQGNQVITVGTTVIYAFVAVLTPRIAALYAEKNDIQIKKYMSNAIANVYFMGLPMMMGCIAVAKLFVPVFFGKGYGPVVLLMQVMSVLFVIIGIDQLVGTFLVSMNKQNIFTVAVTVAAVVNIIFNTLFIYLGMGALGVAYATIISELSTTIIEIIGLRSYIKLSDFYFYFIKYLIPSVIMYVAIRILNIFLAYGTLKLVILIVMGVLIYFMYMIISKDPLFYPLIDKYIHHM